MKIGNEVFDVTIIGGGPVGLFSAFYCGMRELKTKVIECAPELGGKVLFYPDKVLHDIGGVSAITGAELIEQVIKQGKTFEPEIVLGERIHGLVRLADGSFELTAERGAKHYTRAILLAIGHGVFVPIKLEQEGVERYEGRHLHYAVDDIERFRGKRVVISGGGDSAVDWANAIEPIAASLTVVHRRAEFGGLESNVTRMRQSSATVLTPYALKSVDGDGERIGRVTVEHAETKETLSIEADEVLVHHGIRGDFGGIRDWGLRFDDERIAVNARMETNIPGIFAAGDIVNHPGKLKLIAGGFMEGPMAVNSVKAYLAPQEEVLPIYSTHHDKLIAMHG